MKCSSFSNPDLKWFTSIMIRVVGKSSAAIRPKSQIWRGVWMIICMATGHCGFGSIYTRRRIIVENLFIQLYSIMTQLHLLGTNMGHLFEEHIHHESTQDKKTYEAFITGDLP